MSNTYFTGKNTARISPFRIFTDQAGYHENARKIAVMPFRADIFAVIDENGDKLYEGAVTYFGFDECSGDDIYIADFSAFTKRGSFRITAGGEQSAVFRIGNGVYRKLFYDTSKAFYYLRCGCKLEEKYAGRYTHSACHTGTVHVFGDNKELDIHGGWHDAGDYGRYVTAGVCACAQLLYAYKMFPDVFRSLDLDIPESGSGIPDILSECRYELDWLIKMQRSDGAVYHKLTTMRHAGFVMPEEDNGELFAFPISSSAAADLCAVCALASRIFTEFDKKYSEKLKEAAELSYKWLEENPEIIRFCNPIGCETGIYGEDNDTDNRYWAAAEMFALTGEDKYHEELISLYRSGFDESRNYYKSALGYSITGGLGSLTYILCDRPDKNEDVINDMKSVFIGEAYWLADKADKSGYGAAMSKEDYFWGSNMELMHHAVKFIFAEKFTNDSRFTGLAEEQLHVLLGRNPFGISYVTGCGEFSCNYPHLRPAAADGIEECIPGMVCGGPNSHLDDWRAKQLIPQGTPPMKCFIDDPDCYSLNEVTIYWNSPVVFVLAYLNSKENN